MEPLQVDIVHFYPADNAQPHNTRKYEVVNELNPTTAVVRRGQPFSGVVRFKRPIDEENDVVQLVFVLDELYSNCGPRAACGPPGLYQWPACHERS
ncbi:unnamed protein product [Plutella xylostella]|uniref:(diamondback moth) hypothetical protein n=1 Tax=Plutella xylostella TaxID=51655 RepID=A0A8S4FGV2_PLUXY|nr:unnamed protein product [Plutella xylostella]